MRTLQPAFLSWKFLPYEADQVNLLYNGSTNTTDAPIIRFGEVLLNYAEAAGTRSVCQAAADASINKLRARKIKKNNTGPEIPRLPNMVISGTNVTANGVVINDLTEILLYHQYFGRYAEREWLNFFFEGFRKK
ncbi:hypothetical protein MASR1M46_19680 [Bacteroidales bacterium]